MAVTPAWWERRSCHVGRYCCSSCSSSSFEAVGVVVEVRKDEGRAEKRNVASSPPENTAVPEAEKESVQASSSCARISFAVPSTSAAGSEVSTKYT